MTSPSSTAAVPDTPGTAPGRAIRRRRPTRPAVVAAWVIGYLLAGLCVAVVQPELGQSPWYPPTAIGIAFLLTCGRRWWPLLLAVELAISYAQYQSVWPAVVSATVTVGEELAIVSLLRWRRFDPDLGTPTDVLRLGVIATLVTAVAATAAVPVVRLAGFENGTYTDMVQVWFIGELTGIVVFLPVLLLVVAAPARARSRIFGLGPGAAAELTLVALVGLGLVIWSFAGIAPNSGNTVDVAALGPFLLCLLPVLWIAIRFGRTRTAVFALAANVVGIVALTDLGHRGADIADPEIITVQLFMLVVSFAGLLVASAVDAQQAGQRKERAVLDASPMAIITMDLDRRITSWNPAAEAIFGWSADEQIGRPAISTVADEEEGAARRAAQDRGVTEQTFVSTHRAGHPIEAHLVTSPLVDLDGSVTGLVALVEDVTDAAEARRMLDLLDEAIAQASESVIITDPDATILYANPATSTISGYPLVELIGKNPRLFKSGVHEPEFFERMWIELGAGRTWQGALVNRAKDGSLFEQEVTISPVRDRDGSLIAYVAVQRDLARERALEADLEGERAERQMVTEALAMVRRDNTAAGTASDLCDAVLQIEGIDRAAILREGTDGLLHVLALRSLDGSALLPDLLDLETSRSMRLRSALGPWSVALDDIAWMAGEAAIASATTHTTAIGGAPIEWDGKPLGILVCGTGGHDGAGELRRRRSTLAAIATHAAALLGPQLLDLEDREAAEQRISVVIEQGAFHPVFQPVFDLRTRTVVGYEALTRFDDGTRPDLMFAEAHRCGLGPDLEATCLRAALAHSAGHLGGAWLSVNVSPDLAVDPSLPTILGPAHDLVLEVTEHVEIADYRTLRAAIDGLPGMRVAVDDAGAGYASLRHILELQPDFVKLDIGLIRGIESDPARQAMVAGMRHFAGATGTLLLAEGIETEAEYRTVADLGVHLGQGYLMGRPEPFD